MINFTRTQPLGKMAVTQALVLAQQSSKIKNISIVPLTNTKLRILVPVERKRGEVPPVFTQDGSEWTYVVVRPRLGRRGLKLK